MPFSMFDSLIHLQDSQTTKEAQAIYDSLIHLFTYKTLKPQIVKMRFSPS